MISKEEVDTILENYDKLVTRAQHVYNRLYTELYKKYNMREANSELFKAKESCYNMMVRIDEYDSSKIAFGSDEIDRDYDTIGFESFDKKFIYDDDALTEYIKTETEKAEENLRRQREYAENKRKNDLKKKEAKERAEYERLKAKYGD